MEHEDKRVRLNTWLGRLRPLFSIVLGLVAIVGAYFTYRIGSYLWQIPDLNFLANYSAAQSIQIFDRADNLICSVKGTENRHVVPINVMSLYIQQAVIAAEDHSFYEHQGVSFRGISRAFFKNLTKGHLAEGGSTITQQLVKNLFFEGEKRTFELKIAELLASLHLESRLSKSRILELYLNEVYFGNNAWGIEQAAKNYFSKSSSELDIGEAAFLAGIIRYPALGVAKDEDSKQSALRRQKDVIEKMAEYSMIDREQANSALEKPLQFKAPKIGNGKSILTTKYPYYVAAVLEHIRDKFSPALIDSQGLRVFTNLDPVAQSLAEQALSRGVNNAPAGVNQGALVTVRVRDGAVLALVGGVGKYAENQWNCATNPHTAGSVFKPFVYLSGFCNNVIDENSIIEDLPLTITERDGRLYKPQNFDKRYMGPISVAKAVALSRNVCAIKVAEMVGIHNVISTAHRAGIRQALAPHLSLALGCSAVSPLEMATAYATFARGGTMIQSTLLRRVTTKSGRNLETINADSYEAFDREPVAQLVDVLQDCVSSGTGQMARLNDRPVAGKTGTSDKAKDLWFVGFTPDMVTAVWVGNKDNKPIYGEQVSGGTVVARIFRDFNRNYYDRVKTPASAFAACHRTAQDLGENRYVEPSLLNPAPAQSQTAAYTGYSGGASAASIAAGRAYRKRSQAARQRQYNYRQAPAGAAVVRSDKGIKEYAWSRR